MFACLNPTGSKECIGSNPCENGGTCVAGLHDYSCECAAGFVGDNCGESTCFIGKIPP